MYSKAKIAGHPLHPMLVAFPIAFYTAAFVGYLYYSSGPRGVFWFELAYIANVAGVITGLLAAIPGFIDWAFGIPRGHPAKKTGLIHMALHVVALLLFGIAALYGARELQSPIPSAGGGVFFGAMGLSFTLAGGFLGWNLVARHHIGIEPTNEQERVDSAAKTYTSPGLRVETGRVADSDRHIGTV